MEASDTAINRFRTIKQIACEGGPFTEASLRWHIFNSKQNGLEAAIIRVGRKILIDTEAFAQWIESHRPQMAGRGKR